MFLEICTKSFIIDTHANSGQTLWRHVVTSILAHPNGWEGAQRTNVRCAAAHGSLISDTEDGRAQIRFVTEA
ncbi:uncharacterized protein EDB91DRAFT_1053980 [Suillus paluster]|uniref:uncharacterized protein n=1 Tax=Suillus paluster TaxID=48578 RepID=UPI001B86491B|nr:uncharacterized protein EDB91DRAFT_1053980 [Suillus paluster]KAG1739206.1 hypothetical protein EDB91DRAFT_1053980 [Suillus paluster]